MQTYNNLKSRILSLALSAAMVISALSTAVFAEGDTSSAAGTVGTIQSFDKLPEPFLPSVGQDAPDHVYALSMAIGTPAEDLQFPAALDAMVERTAVQDSGTAAAKERVAVTWQTGNAYKSGENGTFLYTAVLPEGYNLADGVKLPQIHVAAGNQARAAADAITISVNGAAAVDGVTLTDAVTKAGGTRVVTKLTIKAGAVTTDDWNYLINLTEMKTFEIDAAVTTVANMPNAAVSASIFPISIKTVTVPQAITIGENAFQQCTALTSASVPAATSIGSSAFLDCTALTNANFPAVTNIGNYAFYGCEALTSANFLAATNAGIQVFGECKALTNASFPAVKQIDANAFLNCIKLTSLKLGSTVPTFVAPTAFNGCPATRTLGYVGTDGNDLTGDALTSAIAAYKTAAGGADKWNGWTIAPPADVFTVTFNANGGNVSTVSLKTNANGRLDTLPTPIRSDYSFDGWFTAATGGTKIDLNYTFSSNTTVYAHWTQNGPNPNPSPSGGGGGGSGEKKNPLLRKGISSGLGGTKNTATSKNNVINPTVGSKGATNVVASAIQNAAQSAAVAKATFNNFVALDVAGLKAINDVATKEAAGKAVDFKVNFDTVAQGAVASRVSVDPAALAKVLTEQLPLGVYFNQQKDTQVTNVNKMFDKFFTNQVVTVSYDQKAPLAVNAEFAAKLDLSGLTPKSLYIYSYNRETNAYTRIEKPNYWADSNGYSHITAPLGGSIIITDSPLTMK